MTLPLGVHADIPDDAYHADASLSSTGARKLLPPSTPAHFRWWADNPQPPKDSFDLGKVAHAMILGAGELFVEVESLDRRSKAVREEIAAIRDCGGVPLLSKDMRRAEAMADAVLSHPLAGRLLAEGTPEVTLRWDETVDVDGTEVVVPCRARLDWLCDDGTVVDIKTTGDLAAGDVFRKSIRRWRYPVQEAWYRQGIAACGLAGRAPFLFVVVESDPPHLPNVIQIDPADVDAATFDCDHARAVWARCQQSGQWPGYPLEIATITTRWVA